MLQLYKKIIQKTMELNVHLLIKIQFSTPKLIYNISELL